MSFTIFALDSPTFVRFQNCAVVPDRRQDLFPLAFDTQRPHHVADIPDLCIQIVVRLLPLVQEMEPGALSPFSASVCLCGGNLAFHLQHVNDRFYVPHPWGLNGLLHPLTH